MTGHAVVLIVVFVLNVIVSFLYLGINRVKEAKSAYHMFVVMLCCPVLGPVYYTLSYLLYKFFFSEPVDLEDVIFSKDKVKQTFKAEEERERNLVSIEEAIAVTNEKDLRGLMMNVVRGDIQKTLNSISLALDSEDTETAHYAASVLQDALNEFRVTVEKYRRTMREDPEKRIYAAEAAIKYMNEILKQRVFTDVEQKNYVRIMDEICEVIYTESKTSMDVAYYEAICMRLLEIEEYNTCEKWCDRAAEMYPESLPAFTCRMKLYFNTHDRERFFEVIEELKKSPVVVDRETLEFIRVFR